MSRLIDDACTRLGVAPAELWRWAYQHANRGSAWQAQNGCIHYLLHDEAEDIVVDYALDVLTQGKHFFIGPDKLPAA